MDREGSGELRYPPWLIARQRVLRNIAIVMSISSAGLVIAAGVLTFRTEAAFDEARCPFRLVAMRELAAGVRVTDEGRQCLAGLVEHRFRVLRGAGAPLEIGRRRLGADRFARGRWSWTPSLVDGHVHVRVVNPGAGPVTYKEEQMQPQ